jgi:aspartate racemase
VKTLGLIGGISWQSSAHYYELLNQTVQARLGGHHSAKCLLFSVDFAEIEAHQRAGRWDELGRILNSAALALQRGGSAAILVCANTMHKVADAMMEGIEIPLLHIADVTAAAVRKAGLRRVGLLGTRYTMEQDFYTRRLTERHGLEVLTPEKGDRDEVNRVIFEELVHGRMEAASRKRYVEIIGRLAQAGAQGVIAGCTEIGMLISQSDVDLPLFDTTRIHALAAVDWALSP